MVFEIETKNVYDNFSKNKEKFDFSNDSAKSKYYNDLNAFIVGKMKEEMGSIAIEELVGLKPEMFVILVSNIEKPTV